MIYFTAGILCLGLAGALAKTADPLLVDTDLGQVQGHIAYGNVREWNGIAYAQPPVGELRWEYPLSPDPSKEVFDASFMAPGCPQNCNLPPGNCPEYGTSEDCLFLSVWAPNKPSEDPAGYPVLFWIHGGAFTQGLGDCALYNGTNFAQKDVVTVAINYRLGALGFMASESMKGNYGILDQRLAMEWTQRNIAGFGGNPAEVTIAGQSAGAMSVGAHITSPNSKGLYKQGVMESNPLGIPFHYRDSASTNAKDMMEYLDCPVDDVACMKTKSVDEILDAQSNAPTLDLDNLFINFLPFSPLCEEGGEIPEQPLYSLQEGDVDAVPMLSGSMKDEGQLFVYELFTKPIGEKAYQALLLGIFGKENYLQISRMYPFDIVEGSVDGREALNVLGTDLLFYCPLRNVTKGYEQALGVKAMPTYIYHFEHVMSFDCWGPDYEFCVGWVCHGSELPFVFNVFTDGTTIFYEPTADEVQLVEDLSNIWANFLTTGDPNKGLPIPAEFPLYNGVQDTIYKMEEPGTGTETRYRDSYCDMWDKMGYFY
eukprot:CAMPEP_0181315022 /NCGR_PEP_ID=MMETSP1101-20121128/15141_1 /TAXON_ID=46948 /ORGANISM="Rhodomonas abbreviata, Strain Caron Lab Isolate" /LENGTH=538 /DNA_ID=CAMNT_0023422177 /DNA_START=17 /DNA_END=1633 /DNA_ORIENTATION=-